MVLSSARRAAMVAVSAAMALAFSAACAGATPGEEPPAAGTRSAPDTSGVVHSSPASPAPQSFSPTPRPAVDDRARALGFVDVRTAVPDAVVDLRYATPRNFVGERLYPANARCLVHDSLVPGLRTAAENLRARGETLVFWDCYRPHSVQQRMFEKVPDPAWVAAPGPYSTSHESGRSVDVTLAARNPNCPVHRRVGPGLCLVDMGTDFDSFTPNATAYATQGVSASAQAARARLRKAMAAGGLEVYPGEWWHFDGPGADVRRPIIDVPLA